MEEFLKYIGNYGKYQVYIFVVLLFPNFLSNCLVSIVTFILATPNTRCFIPVYDANGSAPIYESPFSENTFPVIFSDPVVESGALVRCSFCMSSGGGDYSNETLLADNIDCVERSAWQRCDNFVYDTREYTNTIVTTFNIVCDDVWKSEFLKSLFSVGVLIGSLVFGILGDKYGRRFSFLCAVLPQIILLNIFPLINNFFVFCVAILIVAALQHGAQLVAFIIVMEWFGGSSKTFFGIMYRALGSLGNIYVGLMAYYIRNWQFLYWSVAVLSALYIPYFWIFPESVRWLLANKKFDEAKCELKKAELRNKVEIPWSVMQKEFGKGGCAGVSNVSDLFNDRKMGFITCFIFFLWFVDSLCYYGLAWNLAWLPGNMYLNFILASIMDFLCFVVMIPSLEKLGRRCSFVIYFLTAGAFCVASGLVKNNNLIVTLNLLARFTINCAFNTTYVYSAEIFPTVVRNAGMGISSVVSRFGSMLAPQISLLSDYVSVWLPVVIFGAFSLFAAVFSIFLPETAGRDLPETIEDGYAFVKSRDNRIVFKRHRPQIHNIKI